MFICTCAVTISLLSHQYCSVEKKPQLRRTDFLESFGQHLKEVRESKGYSQEQLALKAGLSQSQIYRIEKGLINTTISTALHLAETLEISNRELFDF